MWNDATREQVRTSLLATGASHAPTTVDKVLPWIDREVASWAEHRTRACLRVSVEARWSDDTFDRARWCLEDRKLALESIKSGPSC